jgi:hypothetical protein
MAFFLASWSIVLAKNMSELKSCVSPDYVEQIMTENFFIYQKQYVHRKLE